MAYLSSVLWLLFLIAGAAVAIRAGAMPVDYFPEPHVLFPAWPIIDSERAITLLVMTAALLLAPKLFGILSVLARPKEIARWGGAGVFLASAMLEIALSAILAPILMIQQTLAVASTFAGRDSGWHRQQRAAQTVRVRDLLRFHVVETVVGTGLAGAMVLALVPLWLAPVGASLILAVPLSALCCGRATPHHSLLQFFAVPERIEPPAILRAAHAHGVAIGAAWQRSLCDQSKPATDPDRLFEETAVEPRDIG